MIALLKSDLSEDGNKLNVSYNGGLEVVKIRPLGGWKLFGYGS